MAAQAAVAGAVADRKRIFSVNSFSQLGPRKSRQQQHNTIGLPSDPNDRGLRN